MKAAVVAVGDEVLSGVVVNSNAAMIGELMLAAGLPVVRAFCVGDDVEEIVEVLRRACEGADVVIITGGLGPTPDDLTHEALARLLSKPLVRDEEVVEAIRRRFAAFGRRMPASNARQADRPEGTTFIANPYGTAPGVRATYEGTILYSMPGVPGEARRMLIEQILPELAAAGIAEQIRTRTFHCVGLPESELADRFQDLAVAPNPKMAFLPGSGEIRLRFVATGSSASDCEAALAAAERTVHERVSEFVYGTDGDTLEAVVGRMLAERGLTVATAESCTAGLLSARIADVPGASAYLRGAIVAYASELKVSELGVDAELIAKAGAVSEEVAVQMALGARRRFEVDHALSVTCVAGPDAQDGTEPGTTFFAVAGPEGALEARGLRLPGDRAQVRRFASTFALNLLRLQLLR